jgi:hypothetical protein
VRKVMAGLVLAGAVALTACSSGPSATPSTTRSPVVDVAQHWPSRCISGSASLTVPRIQNPPRGLCVTVGTHLTLTFVKRGEHVIAGPWAVPPVSSGNPSIIAVGRVTKAGSTVTAHLTAVTPGSTSVTAAFNQECAASDTPPCTIPPQMSSTVAVTVVSSLPSSAPTSTVQLTG